MNEDEQAIRQTITAYLHFFYPYKHRYGDRLLRICGTLLEGAKNETLSAIAGEIAAWERADQDEANRNLPERV